MARSRAGEAAAGIRETESRRDGCRVLSDEDIASGIRTCNDSSCREVACLEARNQRKLKAFLAAEKANAPDLSDGEPWEKPVPLSIVPAALPFPVDVFPEALGKYAVDVARAIGCPVDFVCVPMIAVAGGAIGASRALEVKPGHAHRALMYATTVGPPGSAKTPALDTVCRPLYLAQQRFGAEYKTASEKYDLDVDRYQQAKKAARNSPEAKEPEKPTRPTMYRVQVDDGTVEALPPILEQNPRGVTMVRDELTAWVTSANQYKGGKGSDRQFWLKNWAGVTVTIDRKGNAQSTIIPHPFVAVVGGIQPELLAMLRDEKNRADGFMDRILFAFPDAGPDPEWNWSGIPEESQKPWQNVIDELLRLNMESGDYGPRPKFVRLAEDAKPEWQALFDRLTADRNREDFPSCLVGPWAKFKVYAARLALIVHMLRWVSDNTLDNNVDAESVRRAGKLVDYFGSHARKVCAVIDADAKVADARRVLKCLQRSPDLMKGFSRRDLYQHLRRHFEKPDALDAPLRLLVEFHYLRRQRPERDKKPGPSPERYVVNPRWARTQDTQDTHDPDEAE